MLALHGEMLGGTKFNTSSSDCGAIGVNTKNHHFAGYKAGLREKEAGFYYIP